MIIVIKIVITIINIDIIMGLNFEFHLIVHILVFVTGNFGTA